MPKTSRPKCPKSFRELEKQGIMESFHRGVKSEFTEFSLRQDGSQGLNYGYQ
jgi:hypothetical protein